jgi:hypothetical protein
MNGGHQMSSKGKQKAGTINKREMSEYEREKESNIKRNKAILDELNKEWKDLSSRLVDLTPF